MASRIKLKRSTTPNSVPTTSDLTDKEVALNITDRSLFVNNNGSIVEVLNADPNDEKIVPSMFSSSITDGVGNTWYVSTNGTDKATLGSVNPRYGETTGANSWGKTPTTAFASLKYCLDNYAQSGDLIVIASGEYEELFPLVVPDGIAIRGAGLKSTFIKPSLGTNDKDGFLIEGNCNIEDLCVKDFYYDNVNDTGYAFRLSAGYTVSVDGRRPYIQRCSVITKGSTITQSDPRGYASGDAGRGALVDGAIVDVSSAEASLLFNECTFVVPNSVGLYLKNGARCEWLNCFTYFAADSIKGENPNGSGYAGQGRTRLKLNTVNGTFNVGNTITYYDNDGTTVLASGTIDENDGTYIYIDGQGSGSFVEASDILQGKQVIVNGDAQLDTTNKQFGASSLLLDGTGDYLSLSSSPDFGFGTGDFTVEMWVRPSSVSGNRIIYDSRVSASSEVKPTLYLNSGILTYYVNGAARITGATLSVNTWYHVLLSRSGTSTKLFINGTQSGSTYTDTNDYGTTAPVLIGTNIFLTSNWSGHIDEVRVSKGVARYTANFTSTTTEYTPDVNTSLLLHLNGIDGSTDIFDGGISSQDVRSSSGGTAQYITLADYTDFGAELRSIGSASVYGQRGVSALGKGVRLRCIIHNFGYVGTGADQSNDISNVNQANEIIETGGGRVLFTSMDQNGDFRVGNAFFVDQEKGTVSFAGGAEGGNIFDSVTVTSLGNTTTILPTSINVGNLEFYGDTINNTTSNGIELGTRLELLDGTSVEPSLTFKNDNDTGIFRDLDFTGNPLALSYSGARKLQVGSELYAVTNLNISTSEIDGLTVTGSGTNYPAGPFTIPLSGGAGEGATISATIQPFVGSITNKGSGYNPASTQVETITAVTGSGVGGTASIVFYGIEDGAITPGSGYTNYQYNSIPAQGGNGSGANLNIIVSGGQVTSVTIASHGTGYLQGDELFVNNSDLVWVDQQAGTSGTSAGSGFKYTLTQLPGSVKSFSPIINPWSGSGYAAGDIVSFTDTVGSGSNFSYTISNVGVISTATLAEGGSGYNIGDNLTTTYDVDFDLPEAGTTRSNFITGAFTYQTINVTVAAGVINPGGNRYFFDGVEIADLTLRRNTVYNFVFPNPDAYSAHPLKFSTTPDGTHGGGVQYTTNVRDYYNGSGLVQGIQLIVADTTPSTLYYYCTIHPDMPGTSGNEGTLTIVGTFQSGFTATVNALSRDDKTILRNDGSATFTGPIEATVITSGSNIIGTDLLVRSSTGVGGNAKIEGDLTVDGDTVIKGNLTVEGATEFSATVGGAGEVSIGDVDEDTVSIRGDLIVNGTFGVPVAPATLGEVTSAQFYIDQANEKIGFFNHEPQYEVDINGVLYNNQDVWLSSTSGSVSIGRDPETYTPVAKLDINGDVFISDTLIVDEGTFDAPSIKFGSDTDLGLYTYTIGDDNGLGITNKSGKIVGFNKGEIEFFRNVDFIYQKIDTYEIITTGENYAVGNYTNIALTGGSGTGLLADITVGFTTLITNPGAGYTPQVYEDVPITSITSAPAGGLQKFTITAGGTDYANGTYTNVPLNGGSGTNGTANIIVSGGAITQIIPNQVGSGYAVNDPLTVNTADIGGSLLGTLSISNGGSNYTDGTYLGVPLITSSGTGSGATANITVSSGVVSDITVANRGNNYSLSSSLTVDGDTITEAKLGALTIDSAGVGYANGTYTNVPLIYSTLRSGILGTGATANITVSGNSITNVAVNNQGANYLVGDQLTVDSSNVGGTGAGRISTLTISSPGSNLPEGEFFNVNLTGSGSGATINGIIIGGELDSFTLVNAGTGYQQGENLGLSGYSGVVLTVSSLANPSGLVLEVDSINTGSGLALTPATLITGSGAQLTVSQVASGTGGSNATANITVDEFGQVSEVIISDGGIGYSIGDTLKVQSSDMRYDDGSGILSQSTIPTEEMLLTVSSNGNITILDITDFGEGYLPNDILSVSNVNLGNQGSGFGVEIIDIISETTVSIDEKEGSINVKQLDAEQFTIDNSLSLTGSGVAKITSGDLQLNPFSTSAVKIGGSNGLIVPVGTTNNRPIGQIGMIRYNSQENQFEGFNGISFVSLGGVRDVDLNTYITAELVTGENDDTFRFYNGGIQTISLTDSLYRISNVTNFEYVDLNNVPEWKEGESVVSPYDPNNFNPTTNVSLGANTITVTAHNFTEGVRATYSNNGGVSIDPLVNGSAYYVHVVNENTIQLAETLGNLDSEIYVDLTSTSSDASHTLTPLDPVEILYYYGSNVYAVRSTGTFDVDPANAPVHTSGTVTNGSVDLYWFRNIFSSPLFKANNFVFTGSSISFNSNTIKFTGSSTTSSNITTASPELNLTFNVSSVDRTLLKFTNGGGIQVNTNYGSTESYKEILTYELNKFVLKDTQLLSADASIDTSVGNSVNLILVEYNNINSSLPAHSGKIMVEIVDDSTTPKRQYSEISFLISSDSSSAYYTEVSKLYTDEVLCDISVDVDGTGNVVVNVVDVTGSSTAVYTIKAVSNTILV